MAALFRAVATADLEAALGWYERQRRGLGRELLAEIDIAVQRIEAAPLEFPVVQRDIRRAVPRRFPYAIYFRLVGAEVVVIGVLHGHRHPRAWRSRR